ncbi:efflux RND transporter periplasmic adaptor subunit [Ideonella sp. A 288]|uniref:efflux RND transporter periplasmic adaptor subunit n=1 Tax=Ideonella sp. A 288 TaxID=1962181 RepID=UPI000B4A6603|nr:efflux RND transporter periplasmic adaptor subunit [Ideonella sp. A 288]
MTSLTPGAARTWPPRIARTLLALGGLLAAWPLAHGQAASAAAVRPALTVTVVSPQRVEWPLRLSASGSIAAWQEVVVGAEASGWRLVEVAAQVGDTVRRGQLLARLSTDMLEADMAQTRAGLVEAKAVLAEATGNADRARELAPTGVLSLQQTAQILTAEQTAKARVASFEARLAADRLRLAQARIVAPDDGIVSARTALEGAVAQPGQELFRLIRRGRLEWRAEVPAADLARVKPGMPATLTTPSGQVGKGTVRVVAPTVDAQTRNGQVLVDLQPGSDARPGMFARGEIDVGRASGLTLPQTAVVLRDGYASVMRVGADQRVTLTKVTVGRRNGDQVELTAGLAADARVVASGAAFLADGDLVKVVAAGKAAP